MNRFILIAVATIAAGAPVSAATAPHVNGEGGKGAFAISGRHVYVGAADLHRLGVIQAHALSGQAVIGDSVLGRDFQHRQFACIRVGRRLQC